MIELGNDKSFGNDNHLKGLMNVLTLDDLNDDFYESVQRVTFSALFDFVGEEGFDIENATSCRLSSLKTESKAVFTDDDMYAIYLKYINGQVKHFRKVCNRILRSKKYKSHEKTFARNLLNSMRHKDETDHHTCWYVGMTLRGLDARRAEKYNQGGIS